MHTISAERSAAPPPWARSSPYLEFTRHQRALYQHDWLSIRLSRSSDRFFTTSVAGSCSYKCKNARVRSHCCGHGLVTEWRSHRQLATTTFTLDTRQELDRWPRVCHIIARRVGSMRSPPTVGESRGNQPPPLDSRIVSHVGCAGSSRATAGSHRPVRPAAPCSNRCSPLAISARPICRRRSAAQWWPPAGNRHHDVAALRRSHAPGFE